MKYDKRVFAIIILLMVINPFLCWFAGGYNAANNIKILYISQSEILELEKARIANEKLSNRQLFFGKPELAIGEIEKMQKQMETRDNIVLLSDHKIYGSKVRSVSKEVHSEIIKKLVKRDVKDV